MIIWFSYKPNVAFGYMSSHFTDEETEWESDLFIVIQQVLTQVFWSLILWFLKLQQSSLTPSQGSEPSTS